MPAKKLKQFLDEAGVKYVSIFHSPAYSAQEIAESTHIPGQFLAKTVVIKIDGKFVLAILPAAQRIDFEFLRETILAKHVELASEQEFKDLFPDCELGAMPPFGNLFNLDVFAEESLAEDLEIAFSAGTHTELIRMEYSDFERLVKPTTIKFSTSKALWG